MKGAFVVTAPASIVNRWLFGGIILVALIIAGLVKAILLTVSQRKHGQKGNGNNCRPGSDSAERRFQVCH